MIDDTKFIPGVKICFIMPLITDARINRRIKIARDMGAEVVIFSFSRPSYNNDGLENLDKVVILAKVRHGHYFSRIFSMIRALCVLMLARRVIKQCSIIYSFGLDCMLLGIFASGIVSFFRVYLVYELADVREIMMSSSLVSKFLRLVERIGLSFVSRILVTTSAFRDFYFVNIQGFDISKISVLENKMTLPIPQVKPKTNVAVSTKLTIGFFGLLRFQEGWDTLVRIARKFPEEVRVYVRGYQMGLNNFDNDVLENNNIEYGGSYISPDELDDIYAQVDVAAILYDSKKSRQRQWMLPNRFFESIYFETPILVSTDSLLSVRTREMQIGWCLCLNDYEATYKAIKNLIDNPQLLIHARHNTSSISKDYCVGDHDNSEFMIQICKEALES